MSNYCDETYDVYVEDRVKARKEHRCSACEERIPPGVTYWRIRWVFDSSASGVKRCERCQAIHLHLRQKCREQTYGDLWPDERLACGLKYEDEWGDLPEEIAALAFALPSDPMPAGGA